MDRKEAAELIPGIASDRREEGDAYRDAGVLKREVPAPGAKRDRGPRNRSSSATKK